MSSNTRLVAYNIGQGGSRDQALWARALSVLAPDLLFVQESRDPAHSWLAALPSSSPECLLWAPIPAGRWGTGLWTRAGYLTPLPVPQLYTGRVVAAIVEECA